VVLLGWCGFQASPSCFLNSLLVALAKFTIGERLHEKSPPNIHYPGPPWNSCPQSSHKTAAEGHRNRLSRVMDLGNHCLQCRWQENRRRSMLRPNLHRAGTNAAGLEKQWKREHAWWPDLLEKKERQKKVIWMWLNDTSLLNPRWMMCKQVGDLYLDLLTWSH